MPSPKKKKKTVTKRVVPLTDVQEYFIKGNMQFLSPQEIAKKLGVSPARVEEYLQLNPPDNSESRLSSLMSRPAKRGGVVCMTEEASQVADDGYSGVVTQAEINRAAAAGDNELAGRLQEQRDNQVRDAKVAEAAKNSDRWHFIRKPGEGANGNRR